MFYSIGKISYVGDTLPVIFLWFEKLFSLNLFYQEWTFKTSPFFSTGYIFHSFSVTFSNLRFVHETDLLDLHSIFPLLLQVTPIQQAISEKFIFKFFVRLKKCWSWNKNSIFYWTNLTNPKIYNHYWKKNPFPRFDT